MESSRTYPFSDLSPDEIHTLMRAAKLEQARAVREFFRGLIYRGPVKRNALIECETPDALRPASA